MKKNYHMVLFLMIWFVIGCDQTPKHEPWVLTEKTPVKKIDKKVDRPSSPNIGPSRKPPGAGRSKLLARFEAVKKRWIKEAKAAAIAPDTKRDPSAINILLITIDTERADFTTPYGEKLPTSPVMQKLARSGITFKNAYSPAPWTVPAMYSIFTGVYPREHGIVSGFNRGMGLVKKGQKVLPEEADMLTERIKAAGYSTFGICTNQHLDSRYGFAQGFDKYYGGDFSFLPFPNMAVEALAKTLNAQPKFFLWLHYLDPHFPYTLQPPWFNEWNRSKFRTHVELMHDITLRYYREITETTDDDPVAIRHVPFIHKFIINASYSQFVFEMVVRYANPKVGDEYSKLLTAAYKSNIRQTDEAIGEVLEMIDDPNTMIIVTADHGEELFDHGGFGHRNNDSLYDELIKVPLIIKLPGGKHGGKVIDTPVSTIDLYPTILELIEEPVPDGVSGVSLKGLMEGGELDDRPLYSEYSGAKKEMRSIIEYPWKYIHEFRGNEGMLFNLSKDPGEKNDLINEEPEQAKQMRKRLLNWLNSSRLRWDLGAPVVLSPHEIEQLRKMGYMGGESILDFDKEQ